MCLLCTVAISLCKRCLLVFNVAFPSDHVHVAWHHAHTPSTDCWTIASIWAICRPSSALLHYRATTFMDHAAHAVIIVGTSLGRGRKAPGTWTRDASAVLGRSDIVRTALNDCGCDPKDLGPFHGQALGLACPALAPSGNLRWPPLGTSKRNYCGKHMVGVCPCIRPEWWTRWLLPTPSQRRPHTTPTTYGMRIVGLLH